MVGASTLCRDRRSTNVRLPSTPFVLLDDARGQAASNLRALCRDAREIVCADRLEDVVPALERLTLCLNKWPAAGYIAYEAGLCIGAAPCCPSHAVRMEPCCNGSRLFECDEEIAREDIPNLFPGTTHPIDPGVLEPLIARPITMLHSMACRKIRAGDIYQVNHLPLPCRDRR